MESEAIFTESTEFQKNVHHFPISRFSTSCSSLSWTPPRNPTSRFLAFHFVKPPQCSSLFKSESLFDFCPLAVEIEQN
jgi:hypothetical protein